MISLTSFHLSHSAFHESEIEKMLGLFIINTIFHVITIFSIHFFYVKLAQRFVEEKVRSKDTLRVELFHPLADGVVIIDDASS